MYRTLHRFPSPPVQAEQRRRGLITYSASPANPPRRRWETSDTDAVAFEYTVVLSLARLFGLYKKKKKRRIVVVFSFVSDISAVPADGARPRCICSSSLTQTRAQTVPGQHKGSLVNEGPLL